MKTYTVQYSLTGYVSRVADEPSPVNPKEEKFGTREEAIARGRELARQLGNGGSIYVGEDDSWDNGIPCIGDQEFIANNSRCPDSGDWWVNPKGLDLRN